MLGQLNEFSEDVFEIFMPFSMVAGAPTKAADTNVFHWQLYELTNLAAVIAKRGVRYDEAALTNPNGFAGLDGIFRLTSSGVVEREMAVNEVTLDGACVIDAAPTSFVARPR